MSTFNGIVYLTDVQHSKLVADGTLTVGDITLTYDENVLYVTPENDNLIIGYEDPTETTEGIEKQLYFNTVDATLFVCEGLLVSAGGGGDGYSWKKVSGGVSYDEFYEIANQIGDINTALESILGV